MAPTLEEQQEDLPILSTSMYHTQPTKTEAAAPPSTNGFFQPSKVDTANLAPLDASLLTTTLTSTPRPVPALDAPERGSTRICTDHMVTCEWNATTGWGTPALKPYGPLSIMPSASVLHYATECFEGMKLYRGYDGKLRLFRPALNAQRMVESAQRISLPGFSTEEWVKLVVKLAAVDGPKWLPKNEPGSFLYVRPTMIATDPSLGVRVPGEASFYVILSCFPIVDRAPNGLRLLASSDNMIRAWPGGFGWAKVGANYGPSLLATGEAQQRGYHQVLWLLTDENGGAEITESGAMNFIIVWRTRDGKLELVTAPLDRRVILDGITRRSILQLARDRLANEAEGGSDSIAVVERKIDMQEVVEAIDENRFVEAFACGTAFFVAPVSVIHYQGRDLQVPMVEGNTGKYAKQLKEWLKDIKYGNVQHEWAYIVDEE